MLHRFNRRTTAALAAAGLLVPGVAAGAAAGTAASRATASAVAADCAGNSWAMFQHDASRTGATGCAAITTGNVATLVPGWFAQTSNAVTAEPAVANNTVYIGDNGGIFHALDASTGNPKWTFDVTKYDTHSTSYGVITSSATYTDDIAGKPPAVIFGGGGSVFALNASTGSLLWHTDLAPTNLTGPDEVESSPVVVPHTDAATGKSTGVVLVGLDTNESSQGTSGGLVALNAEDGSPMWTFEPSPDGPLSSDNLPTGPGSGCNDVWSSPAVDPVAGLVFFGTGNCPDGHATVEALSLDGGTPVWRFEEPAANHGTDDDFGSSPILATDGNTPVVVVGGKSGWIYVLKEQTDNPDGELINSAKVAQPGQTGDNLAGAIGGFIGSMALAPVGGDPVVFGNSAIPAPFSGEGITNSGAAPDTSLAGDPTRASSLHAYDIATGKALWQEPLQGPSYAPVTESGGVLFAPSTTGFSLGAYDASTGTPLWAAPLAASASGGVAVVGSSIYFGAGTYESPQAQVPPQATGIWMFHLAGS